VCVPASTPDLQSVDRSEAELSSFKEGLNNMDVLYAHAGTCTYIVSEVPAGCTVDPGRGGYSLRGWTSFEQTVSGIQKDICHCLDIGKVRPNLALLPLSVKALLELSFEEATRLADKNERGYTAYHDPSSPFMARVVGSMRKLPMHPDDFNTRLASLQFAQDSDRRVVGDLYRKVRQVPLLFQVA
jgi:hypothetical protein